MMILFLRVETRIFVVAISLFLAGRIKLVSGELTVNFLVNFIVCL